MRFRRAIERRALWMAEDAARELPNLPLEDALQLVISTPSAGHPPKYEKAAASQARPFGHLVGRARERHVSTGPVHLVGAARGVCFQLGSLSRTAATRPSRPPRGAGAWLLRTCA